MKRSIAVTLFIPLIFATSCKKESMEEKNMVLAPVAEKIEKKLEIHGQTRIDPYYWLNDRENPKVIDYLNAENDYYDLMTAHTKQFQEELFEEMKGRIKEDDESVPYKDNGYFYITKYNIGAQYPIYIRKKESLEAADEIIFDVNELAKDHEYYALVGLNVSDDNRMVAFGVDTISRRQYNLHFKNLTTGEILSENIPNTTGGSAWANDHQTIFYTKKDPVTLRSNQIFKHVLGTDVSEDMLVYEEKDETFGTSVYKSKSKEYIIIACYNTLSTEYRVVSANKPNEAFKIIQPRERELEYNLYHYGDYFYLLTNKDGAKNFKLMKTPLNKTTKENWIDVIPHRKETLLEDVSIFKDHLVLEERTNGLSQIRIKKWDGGADYYLPIEEETYSVNVWSNPEFNTDILRFSYNSLTTPNSVIDFNMTTQEKEVKKEQEVLGGKFDKNNYKSERIWAKARDGKMVPISLVYHKKTKLSAETPLLLYGYGSYGNTIEDRFSTTRLSLLDRGFIYATAHIRGSEYLGREWYEDGKMFNKKNTFNDFVDCAKHLIEQNYTSPAHLYAEGGSAGGLLMGAVMNQSPELFNGIIAAVPFVDVVTTMLDDSIPLTTGEYDEWGNPNNRDSYEYMLSYSPYDNVEAKKYPNLFVTTGLHDSQVQYFEPAKWVAKLRDLKTDHNLLVMYTDMDAGHGGASGRFDALKDVAKDYAFLLDLEGVINNNPLKD